MGDCGNGGAGLDGEVFQPPEHEIKLHRRVGSWDIQQRIGVTTCFAELGEEAVRDPEWDGYREADEDREETVCWDSTRYGDRQDGQRGGLQEDKDGGQKLKLRPLIFSAVSWFPGDNPRRKRRKNDELRSSPCRL
jgi:hypothetical protein